MASTRNKNTQGNYCQDQRQNTQSEAWQLYQNGANGLAVDTRLAGVGLNPGQLPWSTLSYNPVDIETFLFGINSTNLVNPAAPLTPGEDAVMPFTTSVFSNNIYLVGPPADAPVLYIDICE